MRNELRTGGNDRYERLMTYFDVPDGVNPFAADYAALGPVEDDDIPAEQRPEFQAIINRGRPLR